MSIHFTQFKKWTCLPAPTLTARPPVFQIGHRAGGKRPPRGGQRAFSLVEVMMTTVITLIVFASFYAGIMAGMDVIRVSRENLRATQIMANHMEGIRLFTWDQLNNTSLLPREFTASYDPNSANGQGGITYTGTVSVLPVALNPAPSYASEMRQITIQLSWQSSGPVHTRQMTTYSARNGLQNYVWNSK